MRETARRWMWLLLVPLLAACQRSAVETPTAADPAAAEDQSTSTAHALHTAIAPAIREREHERFDLATMPSLDRVGQSGIADPYYLVGRELGEWQLGEWANSDRLTMADLRGRVLVVRFWNDAPDEIDDSLSTLQALERLQTEFAGRPVTFVGLYHSKGSLVETEWDDVVRRTKAAGLSLPLAYDRQWATLTQWWRLRLDHLPTTPTFVVNPAGKITHVHPGPAIFPSDRAADAICDADYRALREAIAQALPQSVAKVAK